ncbi:hypothetical protein PUNSTDRAFT_43424 [Punctularia strigosozonata HHB-11173 SS5]|uniref:uncharacterized protein n=1 Tax=Punctularia strigosozonata (strain HHB-11173) TaxID=741275 RepID=UPI00044164FB|nr:uncharacterized protein PUNSTDRAFT_43424 [Punctularia strigosozonata HHB-11173 SS5]EIN10551.1 hypothetical protein PUNSTDRAFT_43424 [Punctularia strigosozonata HHB-11173 SS5]
MNLGVHHIRCTTGPLSSEVPVPSFITGKIPGMVLPDGSTDGAPQAYGANIDPSCEAPQHTGTYHSSIMTGTMFLNLTSHSQVTAWCSIRTIAHGTMFLNLTSHSQVTAWCSIRTIARSASWDGGSRGTLSRTPAQFRRGIIDGDESSMLAVARIRAPRRLAREILRRAMSQSESSQRGQEAKGARRRSSSAHSAPAPK